MTHFTRIMAGTVGTLMLVVYLASCNTNTVSMEREMTVVPSGTTVSSSNTASASDDPERDCVVVERVVDADTLVVEGNRSVRMIGINAPKLSTPTGVPERYAQEALDYVRTMVEGKPVCLQIDSLQPLKDMYGRDLRYVLKDGRNLNALLVEEGLAMVFTQSAFQELDAFRYYENAAKARGLGMWRGENTTTVREESFTPSDVVGVGQGTTTNEVTVGMVREDIPVTPVVSTPSFDTQQGMFVQEGQQSRGGGGMLLTVQEAIKGKRYLGERKKVSFRVQSAWDRGSIVYINSEKIQESSNNFSIVIYSQNRSSFTAMGLDSIAHFYLGETIEAEGVIKFLQGNIVLEVTEFSDIRIL